MYGEWIDARLSRDCSWRVHTSAGMPKRLVMCSTSDDDIKLKLSMLGANY